MRPVYVIYGIALLALLAWGLDEVAVSPLETGDVYPPYSSLRSDPLGAKALYESFAALPGIEVARLYKERTELAANETMLVLGVDPASFSSVRAEDLERYERMVAPGGRLVIAFVPVHARESEPADPDLTKRWQVALKYRPRVFRRESKMPRETALYFEAARDWRPVGSRGSIEREFGRGSIVLVADSFPLSNEGLRDAPDAPFIAALAGPARQIVFDENHFGVTETGSVATLMRKYHLEGAIAVLALAAALFLWRSASSFLPPKQTAGAEVVAGRDAIDGMTALLARGVAEKELLEACFAEWSRSAPREPRAAALESELRRHNDMVESYRAACAVLAHKK
ncbi:MAG TPA: DUF4350 domain-containing protein [Bryobacteraceae bacterium]|jgi:hypothetical protein|nr:DUF4350 domain-containing protein [Bryobacteraceae bacterium]